MNTSYLSYWGIQKPIIIINSVEGKSKDFIKNPQESLDFMPVLYGSSYDKKSQKWKNR